ncbi:MAG TPA: glycosyl hydrolase family 18 protein, partial [Anaerovoracaceae bacterium]|nr:glycosyl hydrolase family 18 protein [Anaerovoracaceae bacterium]
MLIYTVQSGDQLLQIAEEFQVSPESIIEANGLPNPDQLLTGQSLIIPTDWPSVRRTDIAVNGYQYFLGEDMASITYEMAPYLSILTPFSYVVRPNGDIAPIDDEPLIRAAAENQVVPMMCIVNFSYGIRGQDVAHAILNSRTAMENLISNVLSTMQQKDYRGLNIDFEYVAGEDREQFNEFLRMAAERLHESGYFISSAVAPKTGPEMRGTLYEGIDYAVHGALMDFVILMTYEWGYRFGPPQAISPLDKIRQVLDYAVTVIPREKIYFGFQIYARDWLLPHVEGQEAETFSCQEALERAVIYHSVIQFDEAARSPFFRYVDSGGRMHEVWFEDARSAQAKFNTVKEYGLEGISYWALGYPFPQNWTLLAQNFSITRFIST